MVVVIGLGVICWCVGDQVCVLLFGGGYVEYVICFEVYVLLILQGLLLCDVVVLFEIVFIVWFNIVICGGLIVGEWFLVYGGLFGIGIMVIQVVWVFGVQVFVIVGLDEKCVVCVVLGVQVINYCEQDFVLVLNKVGGVQFILDMVGGDYILCNIKVLVDEGWLVMIVFLGGVKVELNFVQIMMWWLVVMGLMLCL